ncbi:MAG: type I secretion system permease/ATPase [Alphaproteobacteria bacterium]|nr:type I secretion system permease/ATPase [Alphaproteobacteria bacterium]
MPEAGASASAKAEKKTAEPDTAEIGLPNGVEPLLACLSQLCSHYGHAQSPDSLVAGLAYDENGMGPSLFCEAARRVGISASPIKKPQITSIPSAILPCVLILHDAQACLLTNIDKEKGKAQVFIPETGALGTVSIQKLQNDYAGYAIYTHPEAEFIHPEHRHEVDASHHWFWGEVRRNASIYALMIAGSLFINLFALVSPLFVMNVYDRVIPNNAIETGWALGLGALAAFVFDFVFRTMRGYLIDFAGRRIDVIAARRIYDQVLDMKLAGRPAASGAFANMLRDFDSVREFFTSATITALVDLPFSIVFLFFVYKLGGSVAFIIVGIIAIVCFAGYLIQMRLKKLVRRSIKSSESKHALLVETIHALETIKAAGADGRFRARYSQYVGDNANTSCRSRFWSSLAVNIATFFQQSASVIIILTGMYLVQSGDLTMGGLIASVILGSRALGPIGSVANIITRYHQAGGALKTLNGIMGSPVERPPEQKFLHRPNLKGAIAFDKVSFAYPGASKNAALEDISFTIQPGEKVGIIGRIGSGKSTIARLMMKLYEPQKGTILIDETDIRQIDPADLRRNFAYIAQDVILFQGSIRDNIAAGKIHAAEDEILAAAKASGAHEFIARHPMGFDAPVGEQGAGLSGGQRQAIAMARAFLGNPQVLICDEPTNAMDTQAEQAFSDYIRNHTAGKTFVLVTHKHNMLPLVDRLILLHQGKIIMDGPRDEVIAALQTGSIQVRKG